LVVRSAEKLRKVNLPDNSSVQASVENGDQWPLICFEARQVAEIE
jgi:hypothetical protein